MIDLSFLTSKISAYLIGGVGIFSFVFYIFFKGKNTGIKEIQNEINSKSLKSIYNYFKKQGVFNEKITKTNNAFNGVDWDDIDSLRKKEGNVSVQKAADAIMRKRNKKLQK